MKRAKIIVYIRKQNDSNTPLVPPSWEIAEEQMDGFLCIHWEEKIRMHSFTSAI